MRNFLLFILLLIPIFGFNQSVIMSDSSFIIIESGATLVIGNTSTNSFIKVGNNGGIITESEDSKILLKSVNQLGDYEIPFSSTNGNTIPFTFTITTLGSNYGDIYLTTWETNDSNDILPNGVSIILEPNKVVDRFWSVDLVNYITRPKGQFKLTYDDSDLLGNLITEDNLIGERWNSNLSTWNDVIYNSSVNITLNEVSVNIQSADDEFKNWTLRDYGSPLPIILTRFKSNCKVEWTTYLEVNLSHFVLEGSNDAFRWEEIYTIKSTNSNKIKNYEYIPEKKYYYYRLKMVDIDESYNYSDIILDKCNSNIDIDISIYPNPSNGSVKVNGLVGEYSIMIYDEIGKYCLETNESLINLSSFNNGIYFLKIKQNNSYLTKKLILIK